jgi:hypothetical protein
MTAKQKFEAATKMAHTAIRRAANLVDSGAGYDGWSQVRTVKRRVGLALRELREATKALRLASKCTAHLPECDPLPEAPPKPAKKKA